MTATEKRNWLETLRHRMSVYDIYLTKGKGFRKWSTHPDYFAGKAYITTKSLDALIAWAEGYLCSKEGG